MSLVKPKYFVPIHGEYRHLSLHAKLAANLGIPESNIFVIEDGTILELDSNKGRIVGRLPSNNVYVDGLVMEDVAGVILRDRKLLSKDGIVLVIATLDKNEGNLVYRPEIISRGFVDARESETLLEQGKDLVVSAVAHTGKHPIERSSINTKIKDTLSKFFYEQTRRRPMIICHTIDI
jgi:ribonuclease J